MNKKTSSNVARTALILIASTAIACVVISVLWNMQPDDNAAGYSVNRMVAAPQVTSVANTDDQAHTIGGVFDLVDVDGNIVTNKNLLGNYAMVYFGFSFCPDICPTALLNITHALDSLGPLAARVQPVFITVDPARDTKEAMKAYASNFHPSLLALTGTQEQVARAAKAYRIYYKLHNDEDKENYVVDHTGYIYLMDPQGQYVTHFTHEDSAEQIMAILTRYIR